MKSMTPFQEALLAATEAQFADVPEEEQIDIQPSPEFYSNRPGKKKSLKPLRKAILIAAALALFVGIAFAAHFFTLGKTEVEIYQFPLRAEEIANGATAGNYVIELKFQEDFSNPNGPDNIETFYLPTLDVCENADYTDYEVGDGKNRYLPLRSKEEIDELNAWGESDDISDLPEDAGVIVHCIDYTDQMPENPIDFHADWFVKDQQITFYQRLAKDIPEIDFFSIQIPGDMLPEARTEMLTIGNYEVLSVIAEWQLPWETDRHTTHHWYWTNGEYFFSISADDVDMEFMEQFMESVQPIEDITAYFGEE